MKASRVRLTDVLEQMGIPRDVIEREATTFYSQHRFGERLVEVGVITKDQLDLALIRQRVMNGEASKQDVVTLRALSEKTSERREQTLSRLGHVFAMAVHH